MNLEVYVIINDDFQRDQIANSNLIDSPIFYFIDERSEKTKAYRLKSAYATKMTPFVVIHKDQKPIKAFYGESEENVINSLINYLNENK